jgi:excisionase family DNA binding protein
MPMRKTRSCVEAAASFAEHSTSCSGSPDLREVLRGDASAWRRFVAYYEPPLRALVHDAAEATELFSDADVDDVLGDFWLAVVSDQMRMLRGFKPERGADLLTWLALHVSHVAHEHLQEKSDAPTFIRFDEKRHASASVGPTVDEAIRAAVRDAISRELRNTPSTSTVTAAPIAATEYVSAARAAEIAGVRPATMREWASRGRLPSHRAGRLMRIRTDDLHRFLAEGREPTNVVDMEKRRRRALARLR